MMSGGPINHFTKGWALVPFKGEVAHYWSKTGVGAEMRTACGVVGYFNVRARPLHPGGYPRCKRCQRMKLVR